MSENKQGFYKRHAKEIKTTFAVATLSIIWTCCMLYLYSNMSDIGNTSTCVKILELSFLGWLITLPVFFQKSDP